LRDDAPQGKSPANASGRCVGFPSRRRRRP
jgi:hypothetical protein